MIICIKLWRVNISVKAPFFFPVPNSKNPYLFPVFQRDYRRNKENKYTMKWIIENILFLSLKISQNGWKYAKNWYFWNLSLFWIFLFLPRRKPIFSRGKKKNFWYMRNMQNLRRFYSKFCGTNTWRYFWILSPQTSQIPHAEFAVKTPQILHIPHISKVLKIEYFGQ